MIPPLPLPPPRAARRSMRVSIVAACHSTDPAMLHATRRVVRKYGYFCCRRSVALPQPGRILPFPQVYSGKITGVSSVAACHNTRPVMLHVKRMVVRNYGYYCCGRPDASPQPGCILPFTQACSYLIFLHPFCVTNSRNDIHQWLWLCQ